MPSSPESSWIASLRPDFWPIGRSVCDRIAGDDHARAFAEPGQEHLHLHRGRVLRLVEQDAGVDKGSPAHEGERRDLDHAGLQAALQHARVHEVGERVEDRPQIGIDLVAHVAGQEAEPLAGFDGRARQDQALDGALFEQQHRIADGEPGLAGAGGALGEDEFMALQRAQVEVLRGVAGAHGTAPARADLLEGDASGLGLPGKQRALQGAFLDRAVDVAERDRLAKLDPAIQFSSTSRACSQASCDPLMVTRLPLALAMTPRRRSSLARF